MKAIDKNELRQGIGSELWTELPAHKRERKYTSPGDTVAPCSKIGFRTDINSCPADLHEVMCRTRKAAG